MPTWTPQTKAVDASRLEANIIAFIRANQADALLWANGGGAAGTIKPFNFLVDNLANPSVPGLPVLMVTGKEKRTDRSSDLDRSQFDVQFEGIVLGKNADALTALTEKYAAALESMLVNIPTDTMLAGTSGQIIDNEPDTAISYGEIGLNEQESALLQVFTLRVSYTMYSSGY